MVITLILALPCGFFSVSIVSLMFELPDVLLDLLDNDIGG